MKIKQENTQIYYVTLSENNAEKVRQRAKKDNCDLQYAYLQLCYEGELTYPTEGYDYYDEETYLRVDE